jgi:acyl-CoA dehydrogenase
VARELESREFQYPFELWEKFSSAGFHGMGIDEEYGGSGGDAIDLVGWSASLRVRSPA